MKSFLGILFCGGRGVRLGTITEYISKPFVPVYDRPVFMYPLSQLEASRQVSDIVILTNDENDAKLRQTGCRTIIQDDAQVSNMFDGLAYVRKVTGDSRPAVLMPCDNISEIVVDNVIDVFEDEKPDIAISIRSVASREKLREMGVFDSETGTMEYRPENPKTRWGVIAPYVVSQEVGSAGATEEIINSHRVSWIEYEGVWFDIGDPESLALANSAILGHVREQNTGPEVGISRRNCI